MLRHWREMVLGVLIFGFFLPLLFIPPIPQDPAYHQFADFEKVWGIPNFFDVVTSLPFLFVGLLGLIFTRTHQLGFIRKLPLPSRERAGVRGIQRERFKVPENYHPDPSLPHPGGGEKQEFPDGSQPTVTPRSWRTLFGAVALVGLGSAYYHWAPSHWTLVWDRLPMAVGFMALFVALLSENVHPKLETILLIPMCLLAILSVVYWHYTDDLRFYIWVQVSPLLGILVILLLFRGRQKHQIYLVAALGLYILAKVAEVYDRPIYSITQQTFSGHSLKHLLSAWAVFLVYRMLKRRRLSDGGGIQKET